MKQLRVLFGVCVAMLLAASPAAAKDLGGRLAIGGGYTLLGNGGIQAKYYAGHIGIGMVASYANSLVEQDVGGKKGDNTQNEADVSLRVTFNAARAKDTNLYAGGGLTYGNWSQQSATGEEADWSEMGLELIVGVEHFFGNHFSLTFETGMPFRFFSDDNGPVIGRLTGGSPLASASGAGRFMQFGGLSPAFASSFNFYF